MTSSTTPPPSVRKRLCYTADLKDELLKSSSDPSRVTDAGVAKMQSLAIRGNALIAGYPNAQSWDKAQVAEVLKVLEQRC